MSLTSYRAAPSRDTMWLVSQVTEAFSLRKADGLSRLMARKAKDADASAGA